ncbi:hypothetical protein [Anatilimnocola aggregata]|nr:hypothetical protein [Anatilimnocola aggregata]
MARYGGVYFLSTDGITRYDKIVIVTRVASPAIKIGIAGQEVSAINELSVASITAAGLNARVDFDDKMGNYELATDLGLHAFVENGRVVRISIHKTTELNPDKHFAVIVDGKSIKVPIRRKDLESQLGRPDEVLRKTCPPAR